VRRELLPLFFLIFGLAGCASDGKEDPVSCEGRRYAEPVEPQQVETVSALLVDQSGEPLAEENVQVCGTDICIQSASSPTGGVVINPRQPIKKPAFKFGEGRESARFAWLLPDQPIVDLGTVQSVRLPEIGLGEPLTPGTSPAFGGFTLTIAKDATVSIDGITFQTEEEQLLRAVEIPRQDAPAVVDPSLGFELLYAATPSETKFCPPAALSVDNTVDWEPGSRVEIWLHGVDVTEEWAPYGGWAKVARARVSADGERIETTKPGLPVLGVLGFKLE
jgi:hypothetical protein